jgi:pilus assembly protein CpaB
VDTADDTTGGATKVSLLKEPVAVPAPKPEVKTVRVVQRVAAHPGNCIRVITGTQNGQECF